MIIEGKARSLEEHVYERLEEEILTGVYKRGEPLTELSISKKFKALACFRLMIILFMILK